MSVILGIILINGMVTGSSALSDTYEDYIITALMDKHLQEVTEQRT